MKVFLVGVLVVGSLLSSQGKDFVDSIMESYDKKRASLLKRLKNETTSELERLKNRAIRSGDLNLANKAEEMIDQLAESASEEPKETLEEKLTNSHWLWQKSASVFPLKFTSKPRNIAKIDGLGRYHTHKWKLDGRNLTMESGNLKWIFRFNVNLTEARGVRTDEPDSPFIIKYDGPLKGE